MLPKQRYVHDFVARPVKLVIDSLQCSSKLEGRKDIAAGLFSCHAMPVLCLTAPLTKRPSSYKAGSCTYVKRNTLQKIFAADGMQFEVVRAISEKQSHQDELQCQRFKIGDGAFAFDRAHGNLFQAHMIPPPVPDCVHWRQGLVSLRQKNSIKGSTCNGMACARGTGGSYPLRRHTTCCCSVL